MTLCSGGNILPKNTVWNFHLNFVGYQTTLKVWNSGVIYLAFIFASQNYPVILTWKHAEFSYTDCIVHCLDIHESNNKRWGSGDKVCYLIFEKKETYSGCWVADLMCFLLYSRYVFWIDCCEQPHIGRMGMDGSNPQVIINNRDTHTPSALTVDYVNSRIYWADGTHILFSDMDGSKTHRGTEDSSGWTH